METGEDLVKSPAPVAVAVVPPLVVVGEPPPNPPKAEVTELNRPCLLVVAVVEGAEVALAA